MADKVPTIAPTRAQQQPAPDSPFYTKDNMPEGCSPSVRWLFNRGWKCLGEPSWEKSLWYTPEAQPEETSHREPKKGRIWRQKGKKDQMGHPVAELNEEVLMQQDGSPLGILNVPCEQLVVTPAAQPMTFAQAFQAQQSREERDRRLVLQKQP